MFLLVLLHTKKGQRKTPKIPYLSLITQVRYYLLNNFKTKVCATKGHDSEVSVDSFYSFTIICELRVVINELLPIMKGY